MNSRELLSQGYTCVISRGNEIVFSSKESGIKPLLCAINESIDVKGCYADDKIVGKAAALLYAYMQVGSVYAEVISKGGLDVLNRHSIKADYQTLTDRIINRSGDDICPMEKTVAEISDPAKAYEALKRKSEQMSR